MPKKPGFLPNMWVGKIFVKNPVSDHPCVILPLYLGLVYLIDFAPEPGLIQNQLIALEYFAKLVTATKVAV